MQNIITKQYYLHYKVITHVLKLYVYLHNPNLLHTLTNQDFIPLLNYKSLNIYKDLYV